MISFSRLQGTARPCPISPRRQPPLSWGQPITAPLRSIIVTSFVSQPNPEPFWERSLATMKSRFFRTSLSLAFFEKVFCLSGKSDQHLRRRLNLCKSGENVRIGLKDDPQFFSHFFQLMREFFRWPVVADGSGHYNGVLLRRKPQNYVPHFKRARNASSFDPCRGLKKTGSGNQVNLGGPAHGNLCQRIAHFQLDGLLRGPGRDRKTPKSDRH